MSKHEYALYDKQDHELIIGIFTVDEISKMFNTSNAVIYCNISRQKDIKGRYVIRKVESEE
ncbi:hypothetical protein [Anaerorhabdus sp.]|uniref:hypothetical protein n=1 Tax=Anaerorhabdus sp. TaxID=1872524 RepID=UPI002FC7E640